MTLINRYYHFGEGYDPFLITPKWQVAQLNYAKDLDIASIKSIERHAQTDEVFVLMKGRAVLVAAEHVPEAIWFETMVMKAGYTYNIPKGRWHTIVMQPGTEVMIVEDAGTHKQDVAYYRLPEDILARLKRKLEKLI